jgi:hypothetical protein
MKISSRPLRHLAGLRTNRIIWLFTAIILTLSQTATSYALVLNCTQINPSAFTDPELSKNLTSEQKKLFNDIGYFKPVKDYAAEIEKRFDDVLKVKQDYKKGADGKTNKYDDKCKIIENNDQDRREFTDQCQEIEGYGGIDGTKLVDGFYSDYRNQFADSIEKMFTNPASDTSLTAIALAKFDEYSKKQDMLCGIFHYYLFTKVEKQVEDSPPPDKCEGARGTASDRAQTQMTTRYTECKDTLETAVSESQRLMMNHIKSTSAQKRATTLVEKYKSINSQMRDLNTAFARMYAFFQTFGNKLLFKADKQMIGF